MSLGNKLSRRQFFKVSGAATTATLLGSQLNYFTPQEADAAPPTAAEDIRYGVCGVCSMGCAYVAHLRDGRVVRLSGNPNDQTAEGKLCVKGYSSLRLLYDPDRLKYPMMRTNPEKGVGVDPGWVKISWEEAFDKIATKFSDIRDTYGPEALMVVARDKTWQKHFAKSLGTPNHICHQSTCYTSHTAAWRAMITGSNRSWTVDYANSQYILGFGWDGMGKSKNHWGRSVLTAIDRGAKLVIFDPRMSITASKAHEWVPVKPGTDLAAILAMTNVIISEGLYDHNFVNNYVSGFEEYKQHVKQYTPDWAESICEVPAETIARIAREFATTPPAVIASHKRDAGGPNYANSWHTAASFIVMDALAGTIDRPGGHILDRTQKMAKFSDVWPDLPDYPESINGPRIDGVDKIPIFNKIRKGSFTTLADSIISEDPYPIKGAFFWKHNLMAFPNPKHMEEALRKLDMVVVHDIMPSEIVQMADIALPDNTFFEGSGLKSRKYHAMYPQVALRQKLDPLYDGKSFTSISLEILRRMGLNEYAPEGMGGKALKQAEVESVGTTFDEIAAAGGMWGEEKPLEPTTEFKTASGKIEFYATMYEEAGYAPMPEWKPAAAEATEEYPFHFLVWRRPWERMTQSQNDPVLAEIYPENGVLMNKQTAAELGIEAGDYVWVESEVGKIRLRAMLTNAIRPDCVAVDHGFGHWSKGLSVASMRGGGNDGDLIPTRTVEQQVALKDPGMAALMEDFTVTVYKAEVES